MLITINLDKVVRRYSNHKDDIHCFMGLFGMAFGKLFPSCQLQSHSDFV